MKRTSKRKSGSAASGQMRSEYNFDYRKARPNRFAGRMDKASLVVLLDPDISEVFTTPESVNTVLRARAVKSKAAGKSAAREIGKRKRA
jgi:hypothetical protein